MRWAAILHFAINTFVYALKQIHFSDADAFY